MVEKLFYSNDVKVRIPVGISSQHSSTTAREVHIRKNMNHDSINSNVMISMILMMFKDELMMVKLPGINI